MKGQSKRVIRGNNPSKVLWSFSQAESWGSSIRECTQKRKVEVHVECRT